MDFQPTVPAFDITGEGVGVVAFVPGWKGSAIAMLNQQYNNAMENNIVADYARRKSQQRVQDGDAY